MNDTYEVHMPDGRIVHVRKDQPLEEIPVDVFEALCHQHFSGKAA